MPKPLALILYWTKRWKIGGDSNLIVFCGSRHWTRIWIVNRAVWPWEAAGHNSSFSRAVIPSFSQLQFSHSLTPDSTTPWYQLPFLIPPYLINCQFSANIFSGIFQQIEWFCPSSKCCLPDPCKKVMLKSKKLSCPSNFSAPLPEFVAPLKFLLQGINCKEMVGNFLCLLPSTNAPFSQRKSSNFLVVIGRIFCGNWHT